MRLLRRRTVIVGLGLGLTAIFASLTPLFTMDTTIQPACTIYVAPNGTTSGTGPASAPLTIKAAYWLTVPGSVVCLMDGTYALDGPFYISRGGTATAPVTWQAEHPGQAVLIAAYITPQTDMVQVTSNTSYVVIDGLVLDGRNVAGVVTAQTALKASSGTTHITWTNNVVHHMGAAGIASYFADYLTVVGNRVWLAGPNGKGWSSGISLNSNQWSDTAAGFHSIVVGNIVAGGYDSSSNHSDGNGIILDLSDGTYTAASANTPPTLVANNLVYMNGGRCIQSYTVTNAWIINNTCYKNGLDTVKPLWGEINHNQARGTVANNIIVAWGTDAPYWQAASTVTYATTQHWGGGSNVVPVQPAGTLLSFSPLFVAPPVVNASGGGQYLNAPDPRTLTTEFQLQADSPAIGAGTDPATLTTDTTLQAQLRQWLSTDINGIARDGRWDLGAYTSGGIGLTPTLAPALPTMTAPPKTPTRMLAPTRTPKPKRK